MRGMSRSTRCRAARPSAWKRRTPASLPRKGAAHRGARPRGAAAARASYPSGPERARWMPRSPRQLSRGREGRRPGPRRTASPRARGAVRTPSAPDRIRRPFPASAIPAVRRRPGWSVAARAAAPPPRVPRRKRTPPTRPPLPGATRIRRQEAHSLRRGAWPAPVDDRVAPAARGLPEFPSELPCPLGGSVQIRFGAGLLFRGSSAGGGRARHSGGRTERAGAFPL